MLTFAIAAFFVLVLIGAVLVIGIMLFGYRSKIGGVIFDGLGRDNTGKAPALHSLRPKYNENSGATLSIADRLLGQNLTDVIDLINVAHRRSIRS